jgi:hypothetical protein
MFPMPGDVCNIVNSKTINTLRINALTAMVHLQVLVGKLSGTDEYLGSDLTATTNNIRQTVINLMQHAKMFVRLFRLKCHGTKAVQSLRSLSDSLNKKYRMPFSRELIKNHSMFIILLGCAGRSLFQPTSERTHLFEIGFPNHPVITFSKQSLDIRFRIITAPMS